MKTFSHVSFCAVLLLTISSAINAQTTTPAGSMGSSVGKSVIQSAVASQTVQAETSSATNKEQPAPATLVTAKSATSGRTALAPKTATSELIAAAIQTKASNQAVVEAQEAEVAKAAAGLESLRQLVNQGVVARLELEGAERSLAELRTKLESAKQTVSNSDQLITELRKAEDSAKAKPLMASTGYPNAKSFLKPTVLRYGGQGGWSLNGLAAVQGFFVSTFGRTLPISAFGQSGTHNRLGYDHRNAVDVALHPDSAQGQALIGYLQSQGIPYLAFRAAVAGVATGPHIHIGSPSHRI